MPITLQAANKGNRNFQSLGIIISKAGRGWYDTGNANEKEAYFEMPRNYTGDAKGAKEVKIRNKDCEKQHLMVILCITADGHKLPPCHVFGVHA
jgi:hypothetical protein